MCVCVPQDLCDIEDELETKLGVFKVHINGKWLVIVCARLRKKSDHILAEKKKKRSLENPGIDPGTSRMLSERSTI